MIHEGAKWGRLMLLKSEWQPRQSNPAVFDSAEGVLMWTLVCECGRTVEMDRDKFPGKQKMRYCGNIECLHAPTEKNQERTGVGGRFAPGRPRREEPCMKVNFYLPVRVKDAVEAYRMEKGLASAGRAAADLIDLGLAYVEAGKDEGEE